MTFNSYLWDIYKSSDAGQRVVNTFIPCSKDTDMWQHVAEYNKELYNVHGKHRDMFIDILESAYCDIFNSNTPPLNLEEAKDVFKSVLDFGIVEEGCNIIDRKDYKALLALTTPISYALYHFAPTYFFPNLIPFNFKLLVQICDFFDLDIPVIPKKSDYLSRCMYYFDLCALFYDFRTKFKLSPEEFCAFLYDFAPKIIIAANSVQISSRIQSTQAWFIGGKLPNDLDSNASFWQINEETRKGDILVFYEKSPVSSITNVFIAKTEGLRDPFFHYYNCGYIENNITIPSICLSELKSHPYFSRHPLVKKNFQGVNGWLMTSEDYDCLLGIVAQKGGDVVCLPKLYTPATNFTAKLKSEKDVESELLEPLLIDLGVTVNNYERQLKIKIGVKERVFSDYALFVNKNLSDPSAHVIIEAKFHMSNNKEVDMAFTQAYSYAKLLNSKVIILCDKNYLLIYEKTECFDRGSYKKYFWSQINENPDVFRDLKNIIFSKK